MNLKGAMVMGVTAVDAEISMLISELYNLSSFDVFYHSDLNNKHWSWRCVVIHSFYKCTEYHTRKSCVTYINFQSVQLF